MEKYLVGAMFLGYGAVAVVRPDLMAKYQTWVNKKILGAKFEASERTLKFYRGVGLLFLGFSGLVLFGVIE